MSDHGFKANGTQRGGKRKRTSNDDTFDIKMVFEAFSSLPRVLKLVWSTHAGYTFGMGLVTVLRGFSPAASAWVTKTGDRQRY